MIAEHHAAAIICRTTKTLDLLRRKDFILLIELAQWFRSRVYQIENFFDWARDDGFLFVFDNRTLQERRMFDDEANYFIAGRVFGNAEFFVNRLFATHDFKRLKIGFIEQTANDFRRQRFGKIIDLFKLEAALPEQPSQIPARRSSRFFVDDDFLRHKTSLNSNPFFDKRPPKFRARCGAPSPPPFARCLQAAHHQILALFAETVAEIRRPFPPARS